MTSDIAFAGAAEQARLLADGAITAPTLLETYLDRIRPAEPRAARLPGGARGVGPRRGGDRAGRLDAGERLPLLGVPVAIKDDVDVAGEVTTYGHQRTRPGERARRRGGASAPRGGSGDRRQDARAGAVHLAVHRVADVRRHPKPVGHRTARPAAAAAGRRAAVAAGLAGLALGSDGMGSIRIPSTWCGVFGIKPQRDRVPLAPHDDAWYGLSVNGPIARTVDDAALFLDVTDVDARARGRVRRGRGALRPGGCESR